MKKTTNTIFFVYFVVISQFCYCQELKFLSVVTSKSASMTKKVEVKIPEKYSGATIDPSVYKTNPYAIITRKIKITKKKEGKTLLFEVNRVQRGFDKDIDTDTDKPYPENQQQKAALAFDQTYVEIPFDKSCSNEYKDINSKKYNFKISKLFRRGLPMLHPISELSGILFDNLKIETTTWSDTLSDGEFIYYNNFKIEETYNDSLKISFTSLAVILSDEHINPKMSDNIVTEANAINTQTILKNSGTNFDGSFIADKKKSIIKNFYCNRYEKIKLSGQISEKIRHQILTVTNKLN